MIKLGLSMYEIDQVVPTTVLIHKRKLEEYQALQERWKQALTLKPWTCAVTKLRYQTPGTLTIHPDVVICNWLNKNIKKPRIHKQKQLYIHGPPNVGKTGLILKLEQMLRVYHCPMDEEFYDEYSDSDYDIIVLDEFKSSKKITFLNKLLEGAPMSLRKKGAQLLKRKNLPIVICSNYTLQEAYHNVQAMEPQRIDLLERRLEIVEVKEYIKISFDGISDIIDDGEDRIIDGNNSFTN